jgi:hypothetical protein
LLAKSLPGRPLTEILGIYPGGFQPGRLPRAFPRRSAGTAIDPEASFAQPGSACISLFDQEQGLLFAADTLMPGGVMGGVFGSGSISDYIQSLERLTGLNSKILLSGNGRLSDTPQDDVRIATRRSHALLSDTAQLFDALDARSNFEPIMQSVRDLNKLDDS